MLVPVTLSGLLQTAWSAYPATIDKAAEDWALAYDTYAATAQACNLLGPTEVNLTALEDGIKAAVTAGGNYETVAQAIALAHEAYWVGAKFGETGEVDSIDGTNDLKNDLKNLWADQVATPVLFPASAVAHAAVFDVFTRTVKVKDSAVPSPSGCPPTFIQ